MANGRELKNLKKFQPKIERKTGANMTILDLAYMAEFVVLFVVLPALWDVKRIRKNQ